MTLIYNTCTTNTEARRKLFCGFMPTTNQIKEVRREEKRTHSPGEAEHTKQTHQACQLPNYSTDRENGESRKDFKEVERKTYWRLYRREVESMGSSHPNGETHTTYTQPPDMPYFKRRKCTDTSISDSTAQTSAGMHISMQAT